MGLAIRQSAPPTSSVTPESRGFRFTWVVSDDEVRRKAIDILDEYRPHSLSDDGFDVFYVTEVAEAQALAEHCLSCPYPIGFDFETRGWQPSVKITGLLGGQVHTRGVSPIHPDYRAMPVTFQISWGEETYVVSGDLLYLFASWISGGADIDFANEHFEGKVFQNVGVSFGRAYRDCIAMDFLLEETLRQRDHGLKKLVRDYLGVEMEQFEAVFSDRSFEDVLNSEPEVALRYAGLDALATTLVCDVLQDKLECRPARDGYNSYELYLHWERPFHSSIRRMQYSGIPINRSRIRERFDELTGQISDIDSQAYNIVKKVINLSSNKELSHYYYDQLSRPVALTTGGYTCLLCSRIVTKRTDYKCVIHGKGSLVNSPSVNDEVLERFASDGDDLAPLIQSRRTLDKKRSTWIDGFYRLSTEDGWGYPTIRSTYVVSGRLSAGIWLTTPGELRDIFSVGESSDLIFLRLDYSQLELRILAHSSGDETMLNAFRTGKDLHCWTAGLLALLRERGETSLGVQELREAYYSEVYDAKVASESETAQVTPRQRSLLADRQVAKTVNFGIAYGMGADRFARQQGTTIEEAQTIFDAVWAMYPAVPKYYSDAIESAELAGELKTLLGRNRKIPELASNSPGQRGYGERLVKNTPCQAGGADIIRAAMILCDMDLEVGGAYGTTGAGAYGDWSDGVWCPNWDYLPKGWRDGGLPPRFMESPGELGRLGYRMALQVHDELVFWGPAEHAEAAGARVQALMEDPFGSDLQMSVPLSVSVGVGNSWDEAK